MTGAAPAARGWGDYPEVGGHYDEARDESRRLRPHWRDVLEAIAGFGPREAERRWQQGRRLLRENGVTYNVYGDPRGMNRPWELDPIPLVVPAQEWREIEAAIVQRAMLLNRIVADVYGPQQLLADGLLPPELVFGHPGFLRPCHGIVPPDGTFLHVYAADLARSQDGRWWVIADRTQAPAGAGYALENRAVLRRTLPDLFRDCRVRRHAAFFESYRAMLGGLAPHTDVPRVVLLTSGPYNETYFEHAYLARHLGIALVEGGDLLVRDQRLFLKTLTGLPRVDVVLRRQDDVFCDPLELYQESTLGVPGLVQAVRAGNVAVANALGSGVTESAAWMAFLETLCPPLLGESLRMPSIATWWCGQEGPRQTVLDNLDRLVVKPTFPARGGEPIFGAQLDGDGRAALAARIASRPDEFVAQEQVSLSVAPVWQDGGLAPRRVTMRVYAVASGDRYKVLPGGLTRVSHSDDGLVVSMQSGGGSKDTWVLGDDGRDAAVVRRAEERVPSVRRGDAALPSRVADNLFWLGRYLERVDFQTRAGRRLLIAIADDPAAAGQSLPAAAVVLPALGVTGKAGGRSLDATERTVIATLFDRSVETSLRSTAASLHRVAWLTRDRLSLDAWRVLSRLSAQLDGSGDAQPPRLAVAIERLDQAVVTIASFSGMVREAMPRGFGWVFLEAGRRIERGLATVELLRSVVHPRRDDEAAVFDAVLDIVASTMTYRSRYQAPVHAALVIDLLLLDDSHPRSVAYQLRRIAAAVERLPQRADSPGDGVARAVARPSARIQIADLDELVAWDAAGRRAHLEALLQQIDSDLRTLSDTLTRVFLTHAVPLVAW